MLLALASATSADAAADRVLTLSGLGAVRVGMSFRETEAALGARLSLAGPGGSDSRACAYAQRRDGRDPAIAYMVEDGRITRIDVSEPDAGAGAAPQPSVRTDAGLGIGSTEAAVRKAYGRSLVVGPHPYEDAGHYLEVFGPDRRRAFLFETLRGRVTSFRAGRRRSVEYIEGCD